MVDTCQSLEEVREKQGDQLETHNSLLSLNLFNLSNIFFQRQAETLFLLPLLSLSLFLVDKANLLRWYINTVFSGVIINCHSIN